MISSRRCTLYNQLLMEGEGAEVLTVVSLRRRDRQDVTTSYHTTAAPKNLRHASPGAR